MHNKLIGSVVEQTSKVHQKCSKSIRITLYQFILKNHNIAGVNAQWLGAANIAEKETQKASNEQFISGWMGFTNLLTWFTYCIALCKETGG